MSHPGGYIYTTIPRLYWDRARDFHNRDASLETFSGSIPKFDQFISEMGAYVSKSNVLLPEWYQQLKKLPNNKLTG
jgi:hypothetical protein